MPAASPRDSSMANKMLIDTTHPEETRVVVLRGNRVEEFDFESANRRQLRGNIYLAKVTRVEPSLQAAFVDYGGNRHGFLAFSEIHPDYYQIPVADRQALIDEEERAARAADAEADHRAGRRAERERERHASRRRDAGKPEPVETAVAPAPAFVADEPQSNGSGDSAASESAVSAAAETDADSGAGESATADNITEVNGSAGTEEESVESVGGDAMEEVPER